MRSECGTGHPRTQKLFEAVERVVQALAAHSALEPTAAAPRTALSDLANRLEHWPGMEHWLARAPGHRPISSGEFRRGPTMRRRRTAALGAGAEARALVLKGKFNDAVNAAETAVESARQLGPGTGLDLADSLTALGLALAALGDSERSLAPFSEALELRERTLSASHPTAATARNNVAFALHRTGLYRRAVDEERKVYRDRVASVGRHTPATWQALVNLAMAEVDAEGHSSAATTLGRSPYELGTSIETGARDVEPDSADFWPVKPARPMLPTLTLYAAVVAPQVEFDWPGRRGISLLDDPTAFELGQARVLQRVLPGGFSEYGLNLTEKVTPGPTPPPVEAPSPRPKVKGRPIDQRAPLPVPERAVVRVLKILEERLGPSNPWKYLAILRRQAPGPFPEVVDQMAGIFGKEHPVTAIVAHDVGVAILNRNTSPSDPFPATRPEARRALEAAEKFARSASETFRIRLGDKHPHLASARELLGITLYHQNRSLDAIRVLHECLRLRREMLGDGHPATADAENTLGVAYYRAGRYGEARSHVERAWIVQRAFGDSGRFDLSAANDAYHSANDLGVILEAQGDLVAARRYFEGILRNVRPVDAPRRDLRQRRRTTWLSSSSSRATTPVPGGCWRGRTSP